MLGISLLSVSVPGEDRPLKSVDNYRMALKETGVKFLSLEIAGKDSFFFLKEHLTEMQFRKGNLK